MMDREARSFRSAPGAERPHELIEPPNARPLVATIASRARASSYLDVRFRRAKHGAESAGIVRQFALTNKEFLEAVGALSLYFLGRWFQVLDRNPKPSVQPVFYGGLRPS